MAEEQAQHSIDAEQLVAGLRERVEAERAAGAYVDDFSDIELQTPRPEDAAGARVRFRPELGSSSKPVIGPAITLVKRSLLRLQLYVFDDLAQQADEAIARVEAKLALEIATRERLEDELGAKIRDLEAKIRLLEDAADAPPQSRAR